MSLSIVRHQPHLDRPGAAQIDQHPIGYLGRIGIQAGSQLVPPPAGPRHCGQALTRNEINSQIANDTLEGFNVCVHWDAV